MKRDYTAWEDAAVPFHVLKSPSFKRPRSFLVVVNLNAMKNPAWKNINPPKNYFNKSLKLNGSLR